MTPATALPFRPEEIRAQLEKILAWEPFARSARLSRFLRYAVEQVLDEPAPELKEYAIAQEVFDRASSFDPRIDPIVRVEARRLRSRLRDYYATKGIDDPIVIRFSSRGYHPIFAARGEVSATPKPRKAAGPISLAVLPFLDLSPKGDQQYLCAGFAEELIHAVARVGGLRVASRTSSSQYEGRGIDVRRVGRELGVDYIIEGSVRTSGRKLRIGVQLSGATDGFEVWSQTYEGPFDDLFAIQERIANSVADSLRARLGGEDWTQVPALPKTSAQAYRMYLRGLHAWRQSDGSDLSQGTRYLERAIAADATFAPAHVSLANSYTLQAWFQEVQPAEAWKRAQLSAEAALSEEVAGGIARAITGCRRCVFEWDWNRGESEFQMAVAGNVSHAMPHYWYAVGCLAPQSRLDEALREIDQAQAIEPLSAWVQCEAGQIHSYRGDYDRAIELFRHALDLQPQFWLALWRLGGVLCQTGDLEEAETLLRRAQGISDNSPVTLGYLGYCYALAGKADKAAETLGRLQAMARRRYISPLHGARIHLGLGQIEAATEAVESAARVRAPRVVELAVDPAYAPLRGEARFQSVVRKVGLPFKAPAGSAAFAAAARRSRGGRPLPGQ